MATLPMAVYGLEVPAGDVAIPARTDIPAAFRITMAAIDPSAEPEEVGTTTTTKPRATLKLIRQPLLSGMMDDDDSDGLPDFLREQLEGLDESSEEDDDEDEEVNGGPSDPSKSKAARKAAAVAALKKSLEEDDNDDMDVDDIKGVNGVSSKGKGKAKAVALAEDDDEDEDDSEDEELDEPEEFVICTLDPERTYQQPLDITIGDDERVFFKVSGTHTIYLTGNYVEPADSNDYDSEDEDDFDGDEYDLTPDEDELDDEDELSEDELDDLADPRITEVDSEEDIDIPALVKADKKGKDTKGKNKRAADSSDIEAATLDEMITKAQQPNGETKLSKKQAKKLKNNAGQAVEAAKDEPSSAKSDKKVSFAEKLETGPTPSPSTNKDKPAAAAKDSTGPKVVNGVTIDVKKVGQGEEAKKGDRVGMRYIGKLKDGKIFDSNKKGKPFSFKLGIGEVIKGWDIGVAGMRVGGERRITVPAHLGYGGKSQPGIPANSALIFDIKCLEIKKA